MSPETPRQRLPFEPAKNRKKPAKQPAPSQPQTEESAGRASVAQTSSRSAAGASSAIPEGVSKRMIRRIAFFCGIPTVLGLSSFVVSYWVVTHHLLEVPTKAVFFVSLGLFGLGVVGLSYGVLSASWDEERSGSLIGWQEFTTNFGRMRSAWRSSKSKS